jgi:hypothetical protein
MHLRWTRLLLAWVASYNKLWLFMLHTICQYQNLYDFLYVFQCSY